MRILFLEIRGVLLPNNSLKGQDHALFYADPMRHMELALARVPRHAVEAVAGLCERANAKIVIASFMRRDIGFDAMFEFLRRLQLAVFLHEEWFPKTARSVAGEIAGWVKKHPDMTSGVAVSAWPLQLRPGLGVRQLCPADPYGGLSPADLGNTAHKWGMEQLFYHSSLARSRGEV